MANQELTLCRRVLARDPAFQNFVAMSGILGAIKTATAKASALNSNPEEDQRGNFGASQAFNDPGNISKDEVIERSPEGRFVRFNRKLGSGPYKVVFLGSHEVTGMEVAWNIISLHNLDKLHAEFTRCHMLKFYKVVMDLFEGNLGGVRITGRRPGKWEERLSAGRNVDLQYKGWHQCGGGQDLQVIRRIKKTCSTVTTAEVSAVSHKITAATVADLSPALCGSGKGCRRATVDRNDQERISEEIDIFKTLQPPNIIAFQCAWTNKEKQQVCFITERITGGSLRQYIERSKDPLEQKVIKNWCRQILAGLEYLHACADPVIHRDLKCDNIFTNGNHGVVIGDLGLSTTLKNSCARSIVGTRTIDFIAPEIYDEKYGTAVDIYAFGMVLLEMIGREQPWSECATHGCTWKIRSTRTYPMREVCEKVRAGKWPRNLLSVKDVLLRDIVIQCSQMKPEDRPSATQLLCQLEQTAEDPRMEAPGVASASSAVPSAPADSLAKCFEECELQTWAEAAKLTFQTGKAIPGIPSVPSLPSVTAIPWLNWQTGQIYVGIYLRLVGRSSMGVGVVKGGGCYP
eukprot:symbB.v1.2.036288.t2/scaffold5089.1/size31073/2